MVDSLGKFILYFGYLSSVKNTKMELIHVFKLDLLKNSHNVSTG